MSAQPVTVDVTVTIEPHQCGGCGVWFGMEAGFVRDRKRDHQGWSCPRGCRRVFTGESDLERLQREKASAERSLQWVREDRDRAIEQRDRTERRRRATLGVLTKVRKRVDHGVCPVVGCQRHFANLGRHMQTQHPTYRPDAEIG